LFPLLPRPALAGKGGAEGQGILKNSHPDESGSSFKKEHKIKTDDFEIRFKLQAYASMYFNEYTIKRRQK
jgi:hypothetical protein